MNFALGAVVLTIILFPGIIARVSYISGTYSSRNFQSSLIDELILSLIPAIFLQIGAYAVVTDVLGIDIDLQVIYKLIVGPIPGQAPANGTIIKNLNADDFQTIRDNVIYLGYYLISLMIAGAVAGRTLRWIVGYFLLDLKLPVLRFNNDWWDIFSGRILDKEVYKNLRKHEFAVLVTALVTTKDDCYLYKGILNKYFLSKESGLDRICLTNVFRRQLAKDEISNKEEEPESDKADTEQQLEELDERYYSMPGHIFVIPYDQIINLDVYYFALTPKNTTLDKFKNLVLYLKRLIPIKKNDTAVAKKEAASPEPLLVE